MSSARARMASRRLDGTVLVGLLLAAVGLLVLGGIGAYLAARLDHERAGVRERAIASVHEQRLALGDRLLGVQHVLGQLTARLNETATREAGDEVAVQELLRAFESVVPDTRELLLVRDDGSVVSAGNVLGGRQSRLDWCPWLATRRARIEARAMTRLDDHAPSARCPGPGTVVIPWRPPSLAALQRATIWLLLDGERFGRELQDSLPRRLPMARWRVVDAEGLTLAAGQHGAPGPADFIAALDRPAATAPGSGPEGAEADAHEVLTWQDANGLGRLVAVSEAVGETGLRVQVMLPEDRAIADAWHRTLGLWGAAAMVFLLAWAAIGTAMLRTLRHADLTLQHERERFDLALDHAEVGVWEWDVPGGTLAGSRQMERLLGTRTGGGVRALVALLPREDRASLVRRLRALIAQGEHLVFEQRLTRPDGRWRWLVCSAHVQRDAQGRALRVLGVLRDDTERIEAARRVSELASHTAAILDNVVDAIISIDERGRIDAFNAAATRMFGYRADEAVGQPVTMLMPAPWRDEHDGHVRRYGETGRGRVIGAGREVLGLHRDGREFPIHLAVSEYRRDGRRMFVGLIRDVTEQRRAEAEIRSLAFFDQLTGLPNRRLLLDRVRQRVLAAERRHEQGALLLLDLDDFKTLNDSRGHEAGDQLLRELAVRLRDCVRHDDTVARLGGDEFVILLDNLGEDRGDAALHAELVVHKLMGLFKTPFTPGDVPHPCHASIGVTMFDGVSLADGREDPDGRLRADVLLGQADLAMYEVKKTGRNGWRFFDRQLQEHLDRRVALQRDLQHGLAHGELEPHYQPQVDHAGRVSGFEALVRWRHPTRGMVPPVEFIPEAESNGQIIDIGRAVLRDACRLLARWRRDPSRADLTVAVNVSVRQFYHPDFVEDVMAALAEAGAPADRLELELTESAFADDPALVRQRMETLRDRGLRFALDDFGTGYSSLAYLKQLPLDRLKIDKSFVHNLLTDPDDASIVQAIVTMGHSLRLEVIAEGVELEPQRRRLSEIGCRDYQGWLFARPMPEALLERWLDERAEAALPAPAH
jgi:diguanylate cyclase (GGDEF)-like protein/PAS domain S-box-containing protein